MDDQKGSATSPGLFCFGTERSIDRRRNVLRCLRRRDARMRGQRLLQNRHALTLISRYRRLAPVRAAFYAQYAKWRPGYSPNSLRKKSECRMPYRAWPRLGFESAAFAPHSADANHEFIWRIARTISDSPVTQLQNRFNELIRTW